MRLIAVFIWVSSLSELLLDMLILQNERGDSDRDRRRLSADGEEAGMESGAIIIAGLSVGVGALSLLSSLTSFEAPLRVKFAYTTSGTLLFIAAGMILEEVIFSLEEGFNFLVIFDLAWSCVFLSMYVYFAYIAWSYGFLLSQGDISVSDNKVYTVSAVEVVDDSSGRLELGGGSARAVVGTRSHHSRQVARR